MNFISNIDFIGYLASHSIFIILMTWLTTLAGAAYTYRYQTERAQHSTRDFIHFCFPRVILHHPSCRRDVAFIIVNRVLNFIAGAPLIFSNTACAVVVFGAFGAVFGQPPQAHPASWPLWVALLTGAVIIQDFMTFYVHYLMHKYAAMWEIHKPHHAAEFLVPITNRRFHPLQFLIDHFGTSIFVGLFLGTASYFFSVPVVQTSFIGIDAYLILNMLSFYHLRHSHVYMRYGWLERYLLSPAQHQLHHSQEVHHWDKNFGLLFSVWDRLFDTIIYANPADQFRVGLPEAYHGQYDSIWKLYATPVVNLARLAVAGARRFGADRQAVVPRRIRPALSGATSAGAAWGKDLPNGAPVDTHADFSGPLMN